MVHGNSNNPATRIAKAMEKVRRDRGEVEQRDLIGLGFSKAELDTFGDDARAEHARLYPHAAAA